MLKKLIYSFYLIFFLNNLSVAQNLIPNADFEIYSNCPSSLGNITLCSDWIADLPSPDYFNRCSPTSNPASVPLNAFGYQQPFSGDGYAGIWCKNLNSYREYIGIQLLSPLQIGTKYFVSFKASLSTNPIDSEYCAINNIGIHLSTVNSSYTLANFNNNYSQFYAIQHILDTSNWETISGSFIADSNYTYISFGNFFNDSLTDSIVFSGSFCQAYYWIDDIRLSDDSGFVMNLLPTEANAKINVYPNPFIESINIQTNSNAKFSVKIYDLYSKLLYTKSDVVIDKLLIDQFDTKEKILILVIILNDEKFIYKLIKQIS